MAVPAFQSFFLPLLKVCSDEKEHSIKELKVPLSEHLGLTVKDIEERVPSGTQSRFVNRATWAKVYLSRAGALSVIQRGLFKISPRGQSLIKEYPNGISIKDLSKFPEFEKFRTKHNDQVAPVSLNEELSTPEEILDSTSSQINNTVADEILEKILSNSPAFFEALIVDLIIKMGYGGPQENAGQTLGGSGDGGIDGLINQDELGLDVIYLQAKRWKESSTVGRPEIQKFAGALLSKKAKKGVFITTTSFSKDALDYVKELDFKIILISGSQLAGLMLKHNLGVTTSKTILIKKMDSDYFEEE